MNKNRHERLWPLTGIIVLLSMFLVGLSIYQDISGAKTLDWPTTIGKVVEKRIQTYATSDEVQGTIGSNVYIYEYSYAVYGTAYTGYGIAFRDISEREFERLPEVGKQVRVFYDDRQPGKAIVIPGGRPFWQSFSFVAGSLLVLMLIVGAIVNARLRYLV